jgi:hypothetical protein
MIHHHFFNKRTSVDSLAEAILTLQSEPFPNPYAQKAISFMAQQLYKTPPANIDPVTHPFKAASLFVATDKTEPRTYLRRIRVKGGRIEASDGAALLRIDNQPVVDGWYDTRGNPVAEPENPYWPDFDRVIPQRGLQGAVDLINAPIEAVVNDANIPQTALARRFQPDPQGLPAFFDVALVDRLIRIGFVKADLFDNGPSSKVLVAKSESKGVTAVVMALRV